MGLGRGYGGWGGDAASMSSVDVVCSDDDRDKVRPNAPAPGPLLFLGPCFSLPPKRWLEGSSLPLIWFGNIFLGAVIRRMIDSGEHEQDATARTHASHDHTMVCGFDAAGYRGSPSRWGRGRGALEGYEDAGRKREGDGEQEELVIVRKKVAEYEELIGDLHNEVESLRKQVKEAREEAQSLREGREKWDAERERATAEEAGKKDLCIAQARREAQEAADAMKKKEVEAEIYLTELESCRQSCARAHAREKVRPSIGPSLPSTSTTQVLLTHFTSTFHLHISP